MSTTIALPTWATPVAEAEPKKCECGSGLPVVATVPVSIGITAIQARRQPKPATVRCCAICLIWEQWNRAQITYKEATQQIEALGGSDD